MLRTLKGLRERGHRVFLICRSGTELERRAEKLGVQVKSFRIRGDLGPLTIFRTWKLIKKENIQLVLTNMDKELRFGGIAAKCAGNCVVIPRRGIDYPLKNKIQYKLSYNFLADNIIANSEATKKALLKNAAWLNPEKIKVIYNGIDPEPFTTQPAVNLRKEWSDDPGVKFIGFVGQLDERKGLANLLRAFLKAREKIAKAHLVIAGEGPLLDEIKTYCAENDLTGKVHLLGFQDKINELMKAFDCLVLPSLWEGFGIVLIEAMAAGKPVITTNVSSMPEIVVNRETGLIVPVNDVQSLTEAILEIMQKPGLARKWGEQGRQRVMEKFTIDRMLDELESLFELSVSKMN
ncbi:glycosyltransferase family 4 protein [candidate division KSB1 bacterium]|nr:glycosyltransferase family 4 protein [candidate division KSB1 bacterium]